MNHHDGFTLIEVLVSLLLISVTALALLQQQGNNKLLFLRMHVSVERSLDHLLTYEKAQLETLKQ